MDAFMSFTDTLDSFLYTYVLVVILIAAGVYFTIATRGVQVRLFRDALRVVMEKPAKEGSVSSFQALMVSTASRVGTGNIIGVASAIMLGGYGAVFWMWIIAFIGGASAFIESTLAQIYKKRDPKGGSYGGPAYYIEAALHSRGLGAAFAIFMILTYAGGFNMLCSYNLQSTFKSYSFYNGAVSPAVIGAITALLVAYCLFGGGKRIVTVTSTLVPFMGCVYVIVALIVVVLRIQILPGIFARIFREAFDFHAIFGGFIGSCMMYGIKRGLYSNEAGVGSAPNAAAAAEVSHPVKQGLVQMLSVFIDTLLLCSCTAFLCLCSGVDPTGIEDNAIYVQEALRAVLGGFGPIFLTVSMVLFAFTTLIGNLFYMDNLLIYLHRKIPSHRFMTGFRLAAVLLIFAGACMKASLLWNLADIFMGCMALINIPVIVILHRTALGALKDYCAQRKQGKNPEFSAKVVGLEGKLDYWE
jgi:AGCS family alanine or glycine:cation symporter